MQQKYGFLAKRFTEISQEVLEIPDSSPRGAAVEFQTATAFWKWSTIETQLGHFFWEFYNRIMQVIEENRSSWFFVIFSLGGCGGVVEYSQYSAEVENTVIQGVCLFHGRPLNLIESIWLPSLLTACPSSSTWEASSFIFVCQQWQRWSSMIVCCFLCCRCIQAQQARLAVIFFGRSRSQGKHRLPRESPWGQWKYQTQTM